MNQYKPWEEQGKSEAEYYKGKYMEARIEAEELKREREKAIIMSRDDTGPCEGAMHPCEQLDGKRAPVMTCYNWDGCGDDPNKPPILCPECTEIWVDSWRERWSDYYGQY